MSAHSRQIEAPSTECHLGQNGFDRWILLNANNHSLAWSGSRWAPVDEGGFPAGDAQISNLDTQEEAAEYAEKCGLSIRRES